MRNQNFYEKVLIKESFVITGYVINSYACILILVQVRRATCRVMTILNSSGSAATALNKHLNEIYITVLKHSVSAEYTEEEKEELYKTLRQILGSIVVLL